MAPFRSTFCGAFRKSIRARAFYEWNYLSKSRSKRVETGGPPSPLPNWSTNKSRFDFSSLPVSIGLGGNSLYFTVRQTFARLFLLCVINQLEEFRFLARAVFLSWRRRRRSSPKQIKLAKLIGFRSLRGPAAATLLVVGDDRGLFWKVFRRVGDVTTVLVIGVHIKSVYLRARTFSRCSPGVIQATRMGWANETQ